MTTGPIIFRARSAITIDDLNHSPFSVAVSFFRWFRNGSGPFGRMTIGSAAFVRSDDSRYAIQLYDNHISALSLTLRQNHEYEFGYCEGPVIRTQVA